MNHQLVVTVLLLGFAAQHANAGVASKAVQEALEFTARKFGSEVAQEGLERLSTRMTQLAAKHGDDVVSAALRKVGPRAGKIAAEAGEQSDVALRLLANYGDDAVTAASRASARQLVSQFGDDAAAAIVRHGTIGEGIVGQFAENGARALAQVNPQNGRRIAMLAKDGGISTPILDVIARFGDRACEFVWANKGALVVGATLTAFLAQPEEFMDGTAKLTAVVGEHVVTPVATEVLAPLAEMPQAMGMEIARGTNWTVIGTVLLLLGALAVASYSASRNALGLLIKSGIKAARDRWKADDQQQNADE